MKPNELLFWLSARRQGSWTQFRSVVQELHEAEYDSETGESATFDEGNLPFYQQLRSDFERLAHVEFFAGGCEKGWRVAPPTLAAHSVPGGVRAVLCGARSPALLERALHIDTCEQINVDGVPQVIRYTASSLSSLEQAAIQIGAHFQVDAPLAILSYLVPCDLPARGSPEAEFPVGADWRIREFDTSIFRWRITDRERARSVRTGLFEFQLYNQWRYFLRWNNATFERPRAIALYTLLRRYPGEILHYEPTTKQLSLPGACRPSGLLERALVLCSGFPPAFDRLTTRLIYREVPSEIAHFAAELLRQRLT